MKSELRAATVKVAKDEAMEDDESVASPATAGGPPSAAIAQPPPSQGKRQITSRGSCH